jgi:hypothetical protein
MEALWKRSVFIFAISIAPSAVGPRYGSIGLAMETLFSFSSSSFMKVAGGETYG